MPNTPPVRVGARHCSVVHLSGGAYMMSGAFPTHSRTNLKLALAMRADCDIAIVKVTYQFYRFHRLYGALLIGDVQ